MSCSPASKHSIGTAAPAYEADVGLCTGFPWLVPQEAIDAPRLGIVNGHPTMLPKGRGPHPWAWAVRTGETEIGLTYHFMDAIFDTGNILAQKAIPIEPDDTEETLIPKFQAAAIELLPRGVREARGGRPRDAAGGRGVPAPVRGRVRGRRYVAAGGRGAPPGARVELHAGAASASARCSTEATAALVRTSLAEVDGAERLDCGDGPLWIVETDSV